MIKQEKKESKLVKFFKTFTKKQIAALIIGAFLLFCGLVLMVIWIIAYTLPVQPTANVLYQFDVTMKKNVGGFGFLEWGIVGLILGSLICAISLSLSSKNEDREKERELRRQQRLQAMLDEDKDSSKVVGETKENK